MDANVYTDASPPSRATPLADRDAVATPTSSSTDPAVEIKPTSETRPSAKLWTPEDITACGLPSDPELDALVCDALNSFTYEVYAAECIKAGFKPRAPLRLVGPPKRFADEF
eukprot:tig00000269_g23674.t1